MHKKAVGAVATNTALIITFKHETALRKKNTFAGLTIIYGYNMHRNKYPLPMAR